MNGPPKPGCRQPNAPERPSIHPELESEQANIDRAYHWLDVARETAGAVTSMVEVGAGGTDQARFERDVIAENVAARRKQLEVGSAALVFGRIDHDADNGADSFHIGRLGVWDDNQDPVVVDWRAPISEAFYRATATDPMGLERRRHFATRGRELLAIDDDLFGDLSPFEDGDGERPRLNGQGALIRALETARTGRLGDIVATVQGEQDEVIRSALPGVLVVQGGPGTGKTVVALHRAAYLLYAHRFPLEGQGVLVVGPNRLFLAYIEQVLPSLGEAGVELATLGDLVTPSATVEGADPVEVARLKGDLVMVDVLRRAVRQRQRPLREDLVVGYGLQRLRLSVERSAEIVAAARRRYRTHNAARRFVLDEVFEALATSGRQDVDPAELGDRLRPSPEVREALEWMWPVLTPAQLLHDFYGSRALLRAAAGSLVPADEIERLHRPWTAADEVRWTAADAPLLDEARALLGRRPGHREDDEVRTYGHIVVDEAQDLSPMELRMLDRRSLNGSMTIVGDIAQATSAWAHDDWDSVLEHLPQKKEPRRVELTIGYRIPAPLMEVAAKALRVAAPDLAPASSIRQEGSPPAVVAVPEHEDLGDRLVDVVRTELAAVESGNVSIIVPGTMLEEVTSALDRRGVDYGRATRSGLEHQLTVVPVGLVKGLEVDATVVVEPARIVTDEPQGHRSLYVALTRSTRRMTLLHQQALPAALR